MHFYLIVILALSGVAVIFIIQNVAAVDVNFLFWTISMSRALLIIFTLAIGFLLGWFLHTYYSYRNAKLSKPGVVSPFDREM
jgi:uncharacterized integral membrane protein